MKKNEKQPRKNAALPRGPHQLSRDDVEASQRERVKIAMVAEVGNRGYAATSVAHIIATAGVSRATFYQFYKDKEDCFLDAFDTAGQIIFQALLNTLMPPRSETNQDSKTPSTAQLEKAIGAYLDALVSHPAASRTFLVEVYAAGPTAIRKRQQSIEMLTQQLTAQFAPDGRNHFALRLFLHGISSMVSMLAGADRFDEIPALKAPFVETAQALLQSDLTTATPAKT